MMADVPHLRFPLRLIGTKLDQVEQDSADDIQQCIATILSTPLGFSDQLPKLGITDQTFYEGGADVQEIQQQLDQHEPRWSDLVTEAPDRLDEALSIVSIRVAR
jgi:phage baseplate assembly protein W